MQVTKSSSSRSSENESEVLFDKSLQELKDLRSQLHYAADYCETTFLNAEEKKLVVENTKEYLCRAVVAVVDHLGSVSAKLNSTISNTHAFSEAELRIDTLKQRLLSCEQFAHKLALARTRWNPTLPKFHRRYRSAPIENLENSDDAASYNISCKRRTHNSPGPTKIVDKQAFEAEDLPFLLHTCTHKPSSGKILSPGTFTVKGDSNSAQVLAVRDGFSVISKDQNPTFHFQANQKNGRNGLFRKSSVHSNDILSLIRRTKRAA